jgi:MoaA/NifB/PqqE/SkfB family radical SAM enzyme
MWQRPHHEEIQKEIGLDQWKRIIDELVKAGIKSTEIFGGNVLLRKNVLMEVLKYLHEKGVEIHLPTNQIGLDDDVAGAIVRYVYTVYVSIDGVDDGQDSIRGIKDASAMAEDSVDTLVRLKRSMHRENHPLRIVCNCTVSRYNCHMLDRIVEYADRKGFDEVHFEYAGEFKKSDIALSKIGGLTPKPYYTRQDESILVSEEEAIELKHKIQTMKKSSGKTGPRISTINIDSLSVRDLWQGTIPHKKCYAERTEVTVDPYGNVVVCPFINNYVLGSLLDLSLEDIWNNERHRYVRAIQNSGGLPMCRHCILGVQRNPGIMKSLERIYITRIQPVVS